MDTIIALDANQVITHGSYEEMRANASHLLHQDDETTESHISRATDKTTTAPSRTVESDRPVVNSVLPPEQDQRRQKRNWGAYAYYTKSARRWHLILWGLLTVVGAISSTYGSMFSPSATRLLLLMKASTLG